MKCPDFFVDPRMPQKGIGTFLGFSPNLEGENLIELFYVVLLRKIIIANLSR